MVIPVNQTLSKEEQEILLDLATDAVHATAAGLKLPDTLTMQLPARLHQPAATFVTLSNHGTLRGCIGTTTPQQPIFQDVIERAAAAASRDPRFPPITPEEVPQLDIEISVLTTPQPLNFSTPEELLNQLKPGTDGVILQMGVHRATFLPQVWERVNDPETFLELLCQKASLHRDAWRTDDVRVETYRVASFHRKAQPE